VHAIDIVLAEVVELTRRHYEPCRLGRRAQARKHLELIYAGEPATATSDNGSAPRRD
jgi:hypothetical protein